MGLDHANPLSSKHISLSFFLSFCRASQQEMGTTKLISVLLLFLLISSLNATPAGKRLVFYFHDIIYNGKNAKNATSAIVRAPAWANKTILAGQNHFGDLVMFDNPITLDSNLHSTPIGRAQCIYVYDAKQTYSALLGFSFVFNSTKHKGSINFVVADPTLNKTRYILVIGGTGDFFMA